MSVSELPLLAYGPSLAANSSVCAVSAKLTNGANIPAASQAAYSAISGNAQTGVASSLTVVGEFNAANPANGAVLRAVAATVAPSASGALLTSLNLGAMQDSARFSVNVVGTGAAVFIPVPSMTAASLIFWSLQSDTAVGAAVTSPVAVFTPAAGGQPNGFTVTIANTKTYAYLVIG